MSTRPDLPALKKRLEEIVRDARACGMTGEDSSVLEEILRNSTVAPPGEPTPGGSTAGAPTSGSSTAGDPAHGGPTPGGQTQSAPTPNDPPSRFGLIGDSPPMRALFALIERVAPSHVSVLIQGETGTGKELVARALHERSPRKAKPFLAENCAAVPASLLESELFGHTKGSFTGAIADRAGHFVAADGGTVFLDEIGDMPLAMQSKLLRVLQEGEVRPVGSNKTLQVDVRIVAASNKDLPEMVRAKTFREDLYFRLNVITLRLPPLRERPGDVRHLARAFAERSALQVGRPVSLSEEALLALERWSWPGNVRELENVILRAAVFAKGSIGTAELPAPIGTGA